MQIMSERRSLVSYRRRAYAAPTFAACARRYRAKFRRSRELSGGRVAAVFNRGAPGLKRILSRCRVQLATANRGSQPTVGQHALRLHRLRRTFRLRKQRLFAARLHCFADFSVRAQICATKSNLHFSRLPLASTRRRSQPKCRRFRAEEAGCRSKFARFLGCAAFANFCRPL